MFFKFYMVVLVFVPELLKIILQVIVNFCVEMLNYEVRNMMPTRPMAICDCIQIIPETITIWKVNNEILFDQKPILINLIWVHNLNAFPSPEHNIEFQGLFEWGISVMIL